MTITAENLKPGDRLDATYFDSDNREVREVMVVTRVERSGDNVNITSRIVESERPEGVGRTVVESASYWDRYETA